MAEQQFCLRWNNFQANIVTSFENLLDREEFVDVTLTAEGKSLKAHRVLLSACSPYFRDLFRDLPAHQHPVIVLRDTSFLELKSLLSFIYHGEVNVSQERLGLLLKTAEALRIKGLAQEKNSEFGSLSSSPEKEPEEGLDRGERRGGGPGSPSLPQAFAGISGSVLAPVNPLVPLDPPSHKPPHVLHSPPPKRRKPLHSPLGGPPVPIPTPPIQRENSLPQAAPVTSTASHEEDATSKVINLTMGTTESSAGSPSPRVIPKLEEEDGPGRGNSSLGGIGIGIGGIGDVGSDQEEEPIKAEDGDDDLSSSTTPDLHGLPQHLNFVPYAAAAAAAAAGSSQLDTFPGPSGVLPPASQAGWRGGHSEPSDTQAQGGHPVFNELLCGDGGYGGKKAVPTPCPVCGKVLSNAYNMRVHLETHQNITYKCIICGIITRTRDTMRKHLSNVHKLRNVELKNSFKKITGKQPPSSSTADIVTSSTTAAATTPTKNITCKLTSSPSDVMVSGVAGSPLPESDATHTSLTTMDTLGALNLAKGNNLASIVSKLSQKQ